uniref:PRC-barrel domain-containing protein n=1 Tax=Peronospora matthiolae TaxID=2874970 RepID=A0AAV1UT54_9STRA
MLPGYAENVEGYSLFDLDDAKVKTSPSVKLDERAVGGIYDTQSSQLGTVTQITTKHDERTVPVPDQRQNMFEPMEPAEEYVPYMEMDDVEPED